MTLRLISKNYGTAYSRATAVIRKQDGTGPAKIFALPNYTLPSSDGSTLLDTNGVLNVYAEDDSVYRVDLYALGGGLVKTDFNVEAGSGNNGINDALTPAQVAAGASAVAALTPSGNIILPSGAAFGGTDLAYPPRIIGCRGQNSSVTGTTTKTVLWQVPIPVGTIGPNSVLEMTPVWAFTNSTNGKTFEIAIGTSPSSLGFSWVRTRSAAGIVSEAPLIQLRSKGSLTVQEEVYSNNYYVNGTLAPVARAVDFTVDQNLYVFGTLTNTTETITLTSALVRTLA